MESFLKYLRGGAVAGNQRAPVVATTIAASVCEDGGGGGDVDDDASFFDLEFAVPGDDTAASDAEEERVELNFAVAGDGDDDDVAAGAEVVAAVDAVAESKKDDGAEEKEAELAPPPASLLRPATKFRVLLLKLRKPTKVAVPAENGNGVVAPTAAAAKTTNRFLIKFRVDDAPLASLFTRDNSSRGATDADRPPAAAAQQQQTQTQTQDAITAEERRFAKEVVLKYLNKIKPLYVKVSRLRFPGGGASEGEETDAEPDPSPFSAAPSPAPCSQATAPSSETAPTAAAAPQPVVVACGVRAPRASVPAGLKQVCKRLGKSRSASSAVAAAPSPSPLAAGGASTTPVPQRRDDSLLQQQDGIQSAIAHCKRSFNASKGSESPLLRSMTMTTGGSDATRDGRAAADTADGGDGA